MIPYSRQQIDESDIDAVVKALRGDILTGGEAVREFEAEIAAYTGAKHAVVFNSGTAALHAAYDALGIGEGDEVITTPLSFAATSNAALYVGATPVFVDIRYDGNIDETRIEAAITAKTKAIVPVDYAGNPVAIEAIMALANKHGLKVFEDAAHAFGSMIGEKKVGAFADVTTFSFHPVKPLTTLEGGALVTDDEAVAETARRFRSHGIERKQLWNMDMVALGYNYRLSDVQCALGRSQLARLEAFIEKREAIARYYDSALADSPYCFTIPIPKKTRSVRHLYPVLLDRSLWCSKEEIFMACQEAGLGVQVHYKPIYQHTYYKERFGTQRMEVAEEFYRAELSIPCHQGMDLDEARYVVESLLGILERYGKGCLRGRDYQL
jgi:UDP-4-amino-4,6-dideoxy-L-N-acetyl-beta-L-altrosamine transaminase